jgi:hypothetical protein
VAALVVAVAGMLLALAALRRRAVRPTEPGIEAGPTTSRRSLARVLAVLIGLIAILGAIAALVAGTGWLGEFRAKRPLLDPVVVEWLRQNAMAARIGAVALGVLLLALGLWWCFRATRPGSEPDSPVLGDEVRADAGSAQVQVR